MSPRFTFEVVGPEEDTALRTLLRDTAMPGDVALTFQREPSFFAAERAGNVDSQIMVVRDTASGQVAGVACRAFRQVYVDGLARLCGYLSNLRGIPDLRGGTVLARAYRYLKDLHADGRTPYYLTTILDDNVSARDLLTSGRAGLPAYHPWGGITTYLLPLYGRKRKPGREDDAIIRDPHGALLDAAADCLAAFNSRHQFGPVYTCDDLSAVTPLLPDFLLDNLYVYQRDGAVTATLGVWDQSGFKQTVVAGYADRYRLARPLSSLGARLGLSPRLPRVGESLRHVHAALVSHAPGHESDLEALLDMAVREWSGRGYVYLAAGAHERSDLNALLDGRAAMRLRSSLYLVYWEDMLTCPLPSRDMVPFVEIATL